MEASGGKHNMPKDSQIIVSMMKDLGIVEYDQQVLNHLLEFNYRYTTQLLEDAKAFSNLAKKKNVDANDVKLAIQMAQKGVFRGPPSREELMKAATVRNHIPLPPQRHASELRIPHNSSNVLQKKYRLRYNSAVYSGENICKDNKKTAAEMLADSRRIEIKHTPLPQSSQMKRALDVEFQEMIKNSQSGQESIGKNDKDKIMDA
ncbi:hypothetical protein QTP88_027266 [Uroleucon formosanum]